MEEYLFVDNRLSHPLDFFYRLHFDGCLDSDRVIAAFHDAVLSHPLLSATIQKKGRRFAWSPCLKPHVVSVQTNDEPFQPSHPAIDITQDHGCRLSICIRQQTTTLYFQFHHAATDGLGAVGFMGDVLRSLVQSECDEPPNDTANHIQRNPARLKQRHSCGFPQASLWQKVKKQLQAIYLSRKFIGCHVSPVVAHQPDVAKARSKEDAYRDIQHRLTVEETKALQQIAKQEGVSTNTIMIRDAFVAIEQFRSSRPPSVFEQSNSDGYNRNHFIRIAIPGNMRSDNTNQGLPAANFFSMTFPAANSDEIESPDELATRLQQEMTRAREDYYFATFLLMLKIARSIPGGLKQMLKPTKCQASLLLTNVGTVFDDVAATDQNGCVTLAEARLDAVDFIAPMRPHQSISLAINLYAGRQAINLSYDPRVHDDTEAQLILNGYIRQLRCSMKNMVE